METDILIPSSETRHTACTRDAAAVLSPLLGSVMLPGQEEPVAPVKGEFGQQFLNPANIRNNFTIISFK